MDLVCFEIFDFGRSGEVRWIAVRSVILLIGRPFFGFAQNSISAPKAVVYSVNLHPGGPPLSLVTKVTGAFAEARISKKTVYSQ